MNRGILGTPAANVTETWFYAKGARGAGSATKNWDIWQKPTGCTFVTIMTIGAGGGGGGGLTRAASAAGGGGGGGGTGAITRATFPASLIPSRLWVQVPSGGLASTGSTVNGGVGGRTYVSIVQQITTANCLLMSGAADAAGGGAGTNAAAGSAGTAGTAAAVTSAGLSGLAVSFSSVAGRDGAAGGAHTGAAGGAITWGTIFMCGGAGGGGTTSADFAGGAIGGGNGVMPSIAGGAAGSNPGTGGILLKQPFATSGGSGGGASNAGVGGAGGDAQIGSGGGGGGAGTTGGAGGNGGDGLVIIWTY